MKKLDFKAFFAKKLAVSHLNQIKGGYTETTYDRADFGTGNTGTGRDKAHGDGCMEYCDDSIVECGIPGA